MNPQTFLFPILNKKQSEAQQLAAIKQAMIQEINAEFLQTYARSFDTVMNSGEYVSSSLNDPSGLVSQVGYGLLCATSPACMVTNIVWRTGMEMFGSQSNTTNVEQYMRGRISRSYNENGYRAVIGSATINLTVSAP